jgi:hypothetical protein
MADCDGYDDVSQDVHLARQCDATWVRRSSSVADDQSFTDNDTIWFVVSLLAQRVVELQAALDKDKHEA